MQGSEFTYTSSSSDASWSPVPTNRVPVRRWCSGGVVPGHQSRPAGVRCSEARVVPRGIKSGGEEVLQEARVPGGIRSRPKTALRRRGGAQVASNPCQVEPVVPQRHWQIRVNLHHHPNHSANRRSLHHRHQSPRTIIGGGGASGGRGISMEGGIGGAAGGLRRWHWRCFRSSQTRGPGTGGGVQEEQRRRSSIPAG